MLHRPFLLGLFLIIFCSVSSGKSHDTVAIKSLLIQSAELQRTNQKQSLELAEKALKLSDAAGYNSGIAGAYIRIGSILFTNGQQDTSRKLILNAQKIYLNLRNLRGAAGAALLLSYIYQDMGIRDSAFSALYQSLRWNAKTNDSVRLAQIYINLGNLFLEDKNPKKAFENFQLAAGIAERNRQADNIISAWDGLGRYYLEIKNFNKALTYFIKVDTECKKFTTHIQWRKTPPTLPCVMKS